MEGRRPGRKCDSIRRAHDVPEFALEGFYLGPERRDPVGFECLSNEILLRPSHMRNRQINPITGIAHGHRFLSRLGFTCRAGLPTTVIPSMTSSTTVDPAPTTTSFPILI